MKRFMRLIKGRRGQDTVEYALLAAFISVVALTALLYIGPWLKPAYYKVQDAMRRAATAQPGSQGGDDKGAGTPIDG